MRLNWQQAVTSALVAFAAGAIVAFILHGTIGSRQMELVGTIALAIGASRLVETKR